MKRIMLILVVSGLVNIAVVLTVPYMSTTWFLWKQAMLIGITSILLTRCALNFWQRRIRQQAINEALVAFSRGGWDESVPKGLYNVAIIVAPGWEAKKTCSLWNAPGQFTCNCTNTCKEWLKRQDSKPEEPCTHKDANGEWTVDIDGESEQCTQCGTLGK
jgi:hypothetical protein